MSGDWASDWNRRDEARAWREMLDLAERRAVERRTTEPRRGVRAVPREGGPASGEHGAQS